jgi:hypothetical protein
MKIKLSIFCFVFTLLHQNLMAQGIQASSVKTAESFPLVATNSTATILFDSAEEKVIHITANCFSEDAARITGKSLNIQHRISATNSPVVIIGTIGKSSFIQSLIQAKKVDVSNIEGQWENYKVIIINHPFKNIDKALCIVGSDARGTSYGVFELSRIMGVHPFYWWADIVPEKKSEIYFTKGNILFKGPSVKYRGIFLNDEDWGLQPWAATKMDTDIKDIGPKTYAHIFELLLRLKANYIWPAMHPCTKAFYYYPENGKVAADYAIVVGTSHCEPMMRNNVFEWAENYKNEYHVDPKEWRYDVNKEQIYQYWNDRIQQVKNYPTVTTIGMRGIHDGSMPGPKDINGKVKLLEEVINDQRNILASTYQKKAEELAQIFCPYKEVLNVYNAGLKLPDDVTIVWSDDNHGYIRQLSNAQEQQRKGGSGVYYHLSYWGRPQDYLWLSTISPSLISFEMNKAYTFNARNLWVFNVGDLKPAEAEIDFSMQLAADINAWQPQHAIDFTERWAAEIFGKPVSKEIAVIKNSYYQLAASGKPEHLEKLQFTESEAAYRLQQYQSIAQKAITIQKLIPARLQSAYYELILYPVVSASLMNEKILFANKSLELAKQGNSIALQFSAKSKSAYDSIIVLANHYNQLENGKWNGIMSWHPRNLDVFKMPAVADEKMVQQNVNYSIVEQKNDSLILQIDADRFSSKKESVAKITVINGLGVNGKGLTVVPISISASNKNVETMAITEYIVDVKQGDYLLRVNCLPTHSINKENEQQIGIAIDKNSPTFITVERLADTVPWDKTVVQGFVSCELPFTVSNNKASIKIYLPANGVVVNTLEIFQVKK